MITEFSGLLECITRAAMRRRAFDKIKLDGWASKTKSFKAACRDIAEIGLTEAQKQQKRKNENAIALAKAKL